MSVFNENGALVYANNSNFSVASLDSIIAESARMDSIIEGMVMEAAGQFDAANIVLETVGYFDESVKEVFKKGWSTALNAVLKAIDNILEFFNSNAPSKKIILINKKKIINKFNEVKNSDNEKLKQCAKAYNSVSRFSSKKLLECIDDGIELTKQRAISPEMYAEKLGFTRNGDWKMDIQNALGADFNANDNVSNININSAIDTATSFDKNIPIIKQKRSDIENALKSIEKSGSDTSGMSDKAGLSMVSYYCVTAIKTLRLLASSSTKLCLAVLKTKTSNKKNNSTDANDVEDDFEFEIIEDGE